MSVKVSSLDHLVLTVRDIEASVAFYERALGMRGAAFIGADGTERWALSFGAQKINLHEAGREHAPHAAAPTAGSADLCFLTETPLAEAISAFRAMDIEIEEGPIGRTGATGPILSIYFRDPDGNLIELSNAA